MFILLLQQPGGNVGYFYRLGIQVRHGIPQSDEIDSLLIGI